jgi:Holliday junction resolvase
MSNKKIKVVVIDVLPKNHAELQKIRGNIERISKFAEKLGGRYEIRIKLDKTLWYYLSQIELLLPILDKNKFQKLYTNLLKILGYFFYISIFLYLYFHFN